MILRHRARITAAQRLALFDKDRFQKSLLGFKPNSKVWVIIKDDKETRSLKQNAYYHGVIVSMLAEFFGYDHDEMHEALKWKFLQKPDAPVPTVRSTRTLDTKEFIKFNKTIKRWAAVEFSFYIPDPNEVDYVW
nr:hypothetical protein 7 [Dehalococcoidia bacterium]